MATEAAGLECKESTGRKEKTERANRKRKTHLTHTGLLMEGLGPLETSTNTSWMGSDRFLVECAKWNSLEVDFGAT
jgi:hypothetical protein